jgi:deoxycytidylate deaminase
VALLSSVPKGDSPPDAPIEGIEASIAGRQTDELVMAFVGPVGSGVTATATVVRQMLNERFGYQTTIVPVSEMITKAAEQLGWRVNLGTTSGDRIVELQRLGTELRKRFSSKYLAQKCVDTIALERLTNGGFRSSAANALALPRRVAHIIDSIKHPDEITLLRQVYGDMFWVFGIFAPEDVRKKRLEALAVAGPQLTQIMDVDEAEGVGHGQQTRDTIYLADFFIRNDGSSIDKLNAPVERFLELIFGVRIHTPTLDEQGMENAATAAASSACLSRQVGAAIYSDDGELIGVGSNDVPKFGGGLYREAAGVDDNRCYLWQAKLCHNDQRKGFLYRAIYETLEKQKLLSKKATFAGVEAALRRTDIKNLIEFSRAVHAEAEAIVSVARGGKAGLVNATMYTTTFPCHGCARLIVASGITRVIYTEPYPKSLAPTLHSDTVSTNELDTSKVLFLQFEGVAPANLMKLFKNSVHRKDGGRVATYRPANVHPIFAAPLDGFSLRERIVVQNVKETEEAVKAKPKGDIDGKAGTPPPELPLGNGAKE